MGFSLVTTDGHVQTGICRHVRHDASLLLVVSVVSVISSDQHAFQSHLEPMLVAHVDDAPQLAARQQREGAASKLESIDVGATCLWQQAAAHVTCYASLLLVAAGALHSSC